MREDGAAPRRILVIQLRQLGDVVLSTGLLEDLHRAFPAATLDFLVGRGAAPLLAGHPLIGSVIVYDVDHPMRMALQMRARRYDWVLDAQSNPRTAVLARLSGARERVGWRVRVRGALYTHTVERSGAEYAVRQRQRFLEALGVPVGEPRTRLALTAEERARGEGAVRAAIASGGLAPDEAARPRVGLVLSAGNAVKEWPAERFGALAARLEAEGARPIVLRNPGDDARIERLRAVHGRALVVDTAELRHLLGVIAACRVLVSGDTGPAHMATALDVPTVTIFGPTRPEVWSPRRPTTAVVRDERAAIILARDRIAIKESPGITGVAVEDVLAPLRALLRAAPAPAPLAAAPRH
jgi:ADP-heptose:LPS heptosyltransferase